MYSYVHYHDENFQANSNNKFQCVSNPCFLTQKKLKINILRKYKCFQNTFITIKCNSAEEKAVIKPVSIYLQHL
jgi:hypothetical protein